MYYIEDYREGQKFVGIYLCKQKQVLKTKAGKTYYSLILQDKTGSVDGKIWELTNGIDDFDSMEYIFCEGMVTSFQGNIQINISRVRKADEGEYDPSDYIPTSEKDIEEMYASLKKHISSIKNVYLKKLLEEIYINDLEFIKNFKNHSAAKSVHHGFLGGLLEHTLSVTNMCEYFANNYPMIKRDLLLAAAMLHDIGKVDELSEFPRNDYTDDGQLLGHIYIGARKIENEADKIEGFPKTLKSELVHCILAHHGKLEFGSPKTPGIMEAMALHIADNADAKLETLTEIFKKAGDNKGWLGYDRFMESNLRKTSDYEGQ